MRCPKCATNNGITYYSGKVCKSCGHELMPKVWNAECTDDEVKG